MSENGQQAPLIERLRGVPAAARVLEHTPNPLGYDTASIPVGALCREAAARIAELEGKLATILDASEDDMSLARAEGLAALWTAGKLIGGDAHAVAVVLYAALAAERKRRGADETDAARYRWLREWRARWEIRYWNGIYWNQLITDELGAAIDAAIAAERGGK